MRITLVIGFAGLSGGVRVATIYAAKLAARGHDVTVVSRARHGATGLKRLWKTMVHGGQPPKRRSKTLALEHAGIHHLVLDTGYPLNPEDVPDADVIIATWWETAFAVADLPAAKGRKFYFVQHHEVHGHVPRHISRGSYYLPLQKITISQWLVDTMADEYGDRDVALVENSVDLDLFQAPVREKNDRPTVGLMYSTTPFKGVSVSLAAIAHAQKQVPNLRVVAFGVNAIDPSLPLPPGSHYEQKPAQGRLRELYAMCDVWLCGSWAEGFHLPPSEAMACRCPVVSTRIGGAVEIVTEGVNGHIVDTGDSIALGDRLADVLLATPDRWKAMSDAALARVQSYTWDDATDKFERALTEGTEACASKV